MGIQALANEYHVVCANVNIPRVKENTGWTFTSLWGNFKLH